MLKTITEEQVNEESTVITEENSITERFSGKHVHFIFINHKVSYHLKLTHELLH